VLQFSFKLEGLKPGTKYEFMAPACSPAGWGSSRTLPFTQDGARPTRKRLLNMKAAGHDSVAIANVLLTTFGDSAVAAFQVLQYAGFDVNDSAAGLRNSSYRNPAA
jgi:hypothetical protein